MKSLQFRWFPIFAALSLVGCAVGSMTGNEITVYDFGLPAAPLSTELTGTMLALEVDAPNWSESPNVQYRLAYEEAFKLRRYAHSRWAGTPGALLARHLRQQLGAVTASANVAWKCRLSVDLQEFSQVFDTTAQSRGVVQVNVQLVDAQRQLLAEKPMLGEMPALTPDAEGGVAALRAASSDLGRQLADWLAALQRDDKLKSCRTAR